MSLVSTFSTFSVRGFGGLGASGNVPAVAGAANAAYGVANGYIWDCIVDNNNNLIGIYRVNDLVTYVNGNLQFSFTSNNILNSWVTTNTARQLFKNTAGDIFGAGYGGSIYVDGAPANKNGYAIRYSGTPWVRSYSYVPETGGASVPVTYITSGYADDSYVYTLSSVYSTSGSHTSHICVSTLTGTLVGIHPVVYIYADYPPYVTPSGQYITNIDGGFATLYGVHGYGFGYSTTQYASGTYRIPNASIQKIVKKGSYCYVSYTNGNSIGIARVDSAFNITNNYTYTVSGATFQVTGLDVDTTNSCIYLSYTENSVDKITRFSLSGIPSYTRTITSSTTLGLKKVLSTPNDSKYYVFSNSVIFQFPSDGAIVDGGSYTVDGVTYTYSIGTQWTNGSTNTLSFGTIDYVWDSYTYSTSTTSGTPSSAASTPLLTWQSLGT